MSFGDILADHAKGDSVRSFETLYKIGKAAEGIGKNSKEKDVDALMSVLKKGWIEKAEGQIKHEVKRMDDAIKQKLELPGEKIDKLEAKVIAAYKKERKKGLEPVKCKATQSAISDLVRELQRNKKELDEIAKFGPKAKALCAKMATDYQTRKKAAQKLRDTFSNLTKLALIGSYQAEMATYMIHCMDLAKLLAEAESTATKLGERHRKDSVEAKDNADMTDDQLKYTKSSAYWEDLEGRL